MSRRSLSHSSPPLLAEHKVLEVVVFNLDDQEYGLRLENVAEVLRMVAITPVPETDDRVVGIINLRGEIVPLLDLHKFLGLPAKPYTLSTHIIIAQADGRIIGLVVDCVTRVATIPGGNIRPQQQITPHNQHLLGVAKTGDCLLLMLDITSILREMEGSLPEKIHFQPNRRKSPFIPELVIG